MSTESVSRSTSTTAVAPYNGSKLAEILTLARAVNARPAKSADDDHYFVAEMLGTDLETASKAYRRMVKQLHPQASSGLNPTPAEALEISDAFNRATRSWAASDDGKNIKQKGALQFSGPSAGVSSVIIMAAQVADTGLRHVRETWDRKVADGTVDRVKTRVAATASDLFAGVGKLAAAGWQAAISRKASKKD